MNPVAPMYDSKADSCFGNFKAVKAASLSAVEVMPKESPWNPSTCADG